MVAVFQQTVQSSARITGVEGAAEREPSQMWSRLWQFCFLGMLGRMLGHEFILFYFILFYFIYLFIYFCLFAFPRATPAVYGGSQARG